jgi:hypothetical protein
MFSGHYDNWTVSRFNGLKKYINIEYFKDKTCLELGAGYGHNGNIMSQFGAKVTSSDVRTEHVNEIKKRYPHLETIQIDCDDVNLQLNEYDIVLHWGVLYHIQHLKEHLKIVLQKCNVLLLETEVCDSDNETEIKLLSENGYDQAYHGVGSRPSSAYIEKILTENGFEFKLIKDSILNSGYHIYDWELTNSKNTKNGLRRFWICWKNNSVCPLKIENQHDTSYYTNTSILICGPLHIYGIDNISYYKSLGVDVIFSTWAPTTKEENELLVKLKNNLDDKKILISNSIDCSSYDNYQNIYYQYYLWNVAVNQCSTPYCIKIRSNCKVNNIVPLLKLCNDFKDYIVASSIFFRPTTLHKYHCGDFIIGGNTERISHSLLQLGQMLSLKTCNGTAEQKITIAILQSYGYNPNIKNDSLDECRNIMKKVFKVIDIFSLEMVTDKTYCNDYSKAKNYDSISTIDEI